MADWRKVKLGEICSFKYGQMPKKEDLAEEGYPVFSGYRVVGYSPKYHYRDPEIVVVARGVGGTGDIKMSPPFCFLTNLSIVTLVESPDVHKAFLFYRLAATKLWDLRTGSAQAQITIERLREYEVKVPPLPVQRRIAGILSAYDDLIENNQRRIKVLEEMARSLYREWFVRQKFPAQPATKNQSLQMRTFGDLCELIKEPFDAEAHANLPLLDLSRIPQRSIAPSETGKPNELTTSRIVFEPGDTLFGAIRCYLHKVVVAHHPGVTNTSVLVLRPKQLHFRSLVALIASDTETIRWADTHSTGTKMPVINWGVFQAMPAPLLSEGLAQQFENIASPMLDQIGVLANQIQNLRRTRDLLLPRLLSGASVPS